MPDRHDPVGHVECRAPVDHDKPGNGVIALNAGWGVVAVWAWTTVSLQARADSRKAIQRLWSISAARYAKRVSESRMGNAAYVGIRRQTGRGLPNVRLLLEKAAFRARGRLA
jgi:hypothetical protein